MKKLFLILGLLIAGHAVHAQTGIQYSQEYKDIIQLRRLKVKYEEALYAKENSTAESFEKHYPNGTIESYNAYKKAVAEVKRRPEIYRVFIDSVLTHHREHLERSGGSYGYHPPILSYKDPNIAQTGYNYFRIVRYSLFEKDMDELAPLKEVPFIQYKEWRLPTYEDLQKK